MIPEAPPPSAFGLPEKFASWRPDQWEAVEAIFDRPERFIGLSMPTGGGKTVAYVCASKLTAGRTVILTATKALQNQIQAEFGPSGLWDIRGQNAYPCIAYQSGGDWASLNDNPNGPTPGCDLGPCHMGLPCSHKEAGCYYYDRLRVAGQSQLVSTNYAFWFAQKRYSQGLGDVDLLVLDEAHQAPDELSQALQIKIDKWLLHAVSIKIPQLGIGLQAWKSWASYHLGWIGNKLEMKPTGFSKSELVYRKRLRELERLMKGLALMSPGDWIEDHTPEAFVFELVFPRQYAESLLFQGAKKVVLVSATLTGKTLNLLGIGDKTHLMTFPSRFPVKQRRVWYIPTVKVDYRMKEEHWKLLSGRVDQILQAWPHHKGIIHAVSFERAKKIYERSAYKHRMLCPHDGSDTLPMVQHYLASPEPLVLVSPSLTTGWDFPDDSCRFAIIAKLPFPTTTSKILKARSESDGELGPHMMAQALVQAVGRGMRSSTDWCVSYILDDNWRWVKAKYQHLFPKFFLEAVKQSLTIPDPGV